MQRVLKAEGHDQVWEIDSFFAFYAVICIHFNSGGFCGNWVKICDFQTYFLDIWFKNGNENLWFRHLVSYLFIFSYSNFGSYGFLTGKISSSAKDLRSKRSMRLNIWRLPTREIFFPYTKHSFSKIIDWTVELRKSIVLELSNERSQSGRAY